ncbi:MAG: hypothetical protein Q8K65_04025 [Alphaproteobacteria bacterium]|nr:hypothetical protein [Alphaproteobacteria bacterium]
MMYPIWPYDGFIDTTERAMNAREWSDALTRALWRKDAGAVRDLFDHTFWFKTDFKPDWFHLYVAVQQESRELVQLMVTRGARWDAQQTAIAARSFGDKIKPFKYVLAGGGMYIDAAVDKTKIDALTAVAMDRRLLAENEKYGSVKPQDVATFNLTVSQLCAQAALQGDAALAKKLYTHHTESAGGLDITPLIAQQIGQAPTCFDAPKIIPLIDRLKDAGVPLKPVSLDTVPDIANGFYTMVAALDTRGLLGGDATALREKMLRRWSYAQEKLFAAVDVTLHLPAETVRKMRTEFAEVAGVLCCSDSNLSSRDLQAFTALHSQSRHRDALTHMDETLLATGFFGNRAFDAESLRVLAQTAPTDGLRETFNRYAQGRAIDDRGLHHFLTPKRFTELVTAMQSKAFKPSPEETRDIVTYLHGRCRRREVPQDVVTAMTALRDCGANFILVDPLRYMGAKHPLLAETMLDLDIVRAKDIKPHKLVAKIPPHPGLGGMFAQPGDSDYARREFLYRVMYEREFPEKAAEIRTKGGRSYQRLFAITKLSKTMDGIKLHQSPRPKPLPRPKFPPPPRGMGRRGPRPGH